jgi:hypothetical protein
MSGRGGKRDGAGRPALPKGEALERVTVMLPVDLLDWAREEGRGNVSAGLRRLLGELDQRRGAEQLVGQAVR